MNRKLKKPIVVIGASGHAKVVIDIIEKQNVFKIAGLIDSYKKMDEKVDDYSILGTEEDLPKIIKNNKIFGGIIAIGDNFSRKKLSEKIFRISPNFHYVTAIHPNAIIGKDVVIGEGTAIIAGTIINSNTQIGSHNIVNTKSSIGHDCKLGDFSSCAPGSTIGRSVEIGSCSAISLGANLVDNIRIGNHSIVGAGSLVLKSVGDYEVAYGIPAKKIRNRKKSDKYLGSLDQVEKLNENNHLKCIQIKSEKDILIYHNLLAKISGFNTFYSVEFCNHYLDKDLHYFLFTKNNEPLVIMPIYFTINRLEEETIAKSHYDVSSPYGFSGPIFNQKLSDTNLQLFWKLVDKWYKKNQVITEFIRFSLNKNHKNYSGQLLKTLTTVHGKLTTFSEIWDNFKSKVRNNYRKAEKIGLRAEVISDNISDDKISAFYNIYIKTMLRKNAPKTYFYSKSYFENINKNKKNKIAIILVYYNDKPISTELIIIHNSTMYSFLGGTLSNYFNLRPNDFLKIELIKWGLKNNLSYYALGGGRIDGDSLYHYKKSFFPKDEDITFYTGRKIINTKLYKKLMYSVNVEDLFIEKSFLNPNSFFPLYADNFTKRI